MMRGGEYLELRARVVALGYGDEIGWQQTVTAPETSRDFAIEAIFVICNSGMRATVARGIFEKVMAALDAGEPVGTVFSHIGKIAAIEDIWFRRCWWFGEYLKTKPEDQIAFLETLPWIGPITKFHLAKNLGLDVAKPDRHLERIATAAGTDPHTLCARLSEVTGDRIATVDLVLWRAAERGLIDTKALMDEAER